MGIRGCDLHLIYPTPSQQPSNPATQAAAISRERHGRRDARGHPVGNLAFGAAAVTPGTLDLKNKGGLWHGNGSKNH